MTVRRTLAWAKALLRSRCSPVAPAVDLDYAAVSQPRMRRSESSCSGWVMAIRSSPERSSVAADGTKSRPSRAIAATTVLSGRLICDSDMPITGD